MVIGDIYVTESEKHKKLEDDLISEKDWKNRDIWIKKTGLTKLSQPITDTLEELKTQLWMRIDTVCKGITQGDNRFVVMEDKAGDLKWSVPVKKSRDSINNPFFDQLPLTSIISVMEYVDGRCHFTEAFEHIAKDKEKKAVSKTDLLACIFANGTNYGLGNIATISDRSFAVLRHTENSYVRQENVHNGNDKVANAISKLPIFQYYNIENDQLYASIDGQKYETRINTFKARYSSKYFKDKGVSAMTLSCNHVALNTTVIGANEYEGHYAFDLLFNNTSDIQPDILSRDKHGTKGEVYHQLRRKVASVNGEKFRGGNDIQVALWNDCARLISNCIIYYNSAILSSLLARVEKMGHSRAKEILCRVSPVAWQRINLNGVYVFEGHDRIELERLLKDVSTDSNLLFAN